MYPTKRLTPKEQAQHERKIDPSLLEKVQSVYGDFYYIPKEREGRRMIPIYQKNGLRVVENYGTARTPNWIPVMLHPDNIMTPHTPPLYFDIVHLLDGRLSYPVQVLGTLGTDLYLVRLEDETTAAITRYHEKDLPKTRAWSEVETTTA